MKKATTPAAEPKSEKKAAVTRASSPPAKAPRKAATAPRIAPSAAKTTVTAQIDVGFGNTLYIRGEGPGLSWDRGALMECASSDAWTWSSSSSSRPFAYKVLINDEQWSSGDDFVAAVGVNNTIAPAF